MFRTGALVAVLALGWLGVASAFTRPDQLEKLLQFRDAMFARPQSRQWRAALESWTCPTEPNGTCDPCGSGAWGNWDHMACRGPRVTYTKDSVPGTGQVTNIHITDYGVEGPVPEELCDFDMLTEYDVDGGALTGPIPTWFGSCFPRLREVDLSYNQLTGTIPKEIADAKTLEQFKVENNRLTGSIPEELGDLDSLNWLRFSDNKMVGTIPQSLAKTSPHLNQLQIGNNDFKGNLYMLANHRFVSFDGENNPGLCGMVPLGVRFAHGYNPFNTGLGIPCPEELELGWVDASN